jgi:hypothetical protein
MSQTDNMPTLLYNAQHALKMRQGELAFAWRLEANQHSVGDRNG